MSGNTVFLDANNIVVNVIAGVLDENDQGRFLEIYRVIFNAATVMTVASGQPVWIGGSYDPETNTFAEPEQPQIEQPIEPEEPADVDPTI